MEKTDSGTPVWAQRAAALGLGLLTGATGGLIVGAVVLLAMDGPSFAVLFTLVLAVLIGVLTVLPGASRLSRRRWAGACGALAGLVLATSMFVGYRSNWAEEVWAVPDDRPGAADAVGTWATSDLVVRAQQDLVSAYRISDGAAVWTWEPPDRDTVCAMSTATHGGLGLIGHAPEGRPCRRTAALDLKEGTTRWEHRDKAPGLSADDLFSRSVALAGDVAVVQDGSGWRGLSAADGRERWYAEAGEGCRPAVVDAALRTVLAVVHCPSRPESGRAEALRLAPATGAVSTRTALPVQDPFTRYAMVAADPLTLWVEEPVVRGTRAVLVIDDRGAVRTTIPTRASDHTLLVGSYGTHRAVTFGARPLPAAVVVEGLLIAPAVEPGDRSVVSNRNGHLIDYDGRLVAISLEDGERRWTSELDDETRGIATGDGSVWVLGREKLFRIDPMNGRHLRALTLTDLTYKEPAELTVHGDRYLVVAENSTGGVPPIRALRPDFVF
ncbi:PQQ-binding-like beta-propeller repeat protein [Streptomyces sp. NPDC012600]|uniref:PQQ-binding-like beta-propeller repeat protein n=2 Tax=Streptomyces TaxID=1883 RepID=A0ABU2W298_9ACTN|nr:PQQ-binding-like beta-propeller repeat protein [Streptomyces griseus]MDT0491981.1 PQQ-binding-like beta-propeller repeat protein [Streptomyces griseus]